MEKSSGLPKGRSVAVEAAPESPASIVQKKIEAVAERDRVLKSLAEARVLSGPSCEAQVSSNPSSTRRVSKINDKPGFPTRSELQATV